MVYGPKHCSSTIVFLGNYCLSRHSNIDLFRKQKCQNLLIACNKIFRMNCKIYVPLMSMFTAPASETFEHIIDVSQCPSVGCHGGFNIFGAFHIHVELFVWKSSGLSMREPVRCQRVLPHSV